MNRHEYKSMSNNFLKSHEYFSLNFFSTILIRAGNQRANILTIETRFESKFSEGGTSSKDQ